MFLRAGFLIAAALWTANACQAESQHDFFENRIRPVLAKSCFGCHSARKAENGLRVDSREALLKGGDSGPAIVPRKPNASLLIQAVRRIDGLEMPPNVPLPQTVVADFTSWIASGADWPASASPTNGRSHWAFQPVADVPVPPAGSGWSDHPVDRFVAIAWKEKGLRRGPPAGSRVLMRRAYFDLLGLPPTVEQQQRFERALQDRADVAFTDLIDELLESPHYGERWGRHWMDVVRYADTAGDNADYPVPEAYLYRDYIIDAFNRDMPFNQFLTEQIAGDILAMRSADTNRYAERIAATGFLALGRRYGTAPYELWHLTLEDVIDTVGRATMGLTMKCARCHDHKFDPITTEDYYALYGIFDSTRFPWAGGEEFQSKKTHRKAFVPLLPRKDAKRVLAVFDAQQADLQKRITALEQLLIAGPKDAERQKELDALRKEHFDRQRSGLPPDLPGAYAVVDADAHDVAVQISGNPANTGATVARNAIAFLGRTLDIPAGQSGRLQLARWITSDQHPLTARVIVNRVWQQHFGHGIVETPSNFGTSGAQPSHPALLDFLTRRFMEGGWRIKPLHRFIMTSKTWQLASHTDRSNAAIDPGNRYCWRHDRLRMDAESIRDAMLSVSGRLKRDRPGRHPFPPFKDWHWSQHRQFKEFYDSSHRSVYLMTPRLQRHPFLAVFDGPDTNTTTARRTSSTVTPQSLYLMNSPEMARWSSDLAARLIQSKKAESDRVELATRLCFARSATPDEVRIATRYVRKYAQQMLADGAMEADAEAIELASWSSYGRVLLSSAEFSYID